jgi:hypothetical protein
MIRSYCLILMLSVSFLSHLAHSQELDSTQIKTIQLVEHLTYGSGKSFFTDNRLFYKVDSSYTLPWAQKSSISNAQYQEAMDSLKANASLSIKTGTYSGTRLQLESYFPAFITDEIRDRFELEIVGGQLNHEGKSYKPDQEGSINFGSKFYTGYRDGENFDYNWVTLNASFSVDREPIEGDFSGQITFEGQVVTDYEYALVTPDDIGKEFTINERTYKVVAIRKNQVALEELSPIEEGKERLDLDFVNVNDDGFKITQIPYFELVKMKEQDSTIQLNAFGTGQSTMSIKVFEMFKANPDLTMEEFKAEMHDKFVEAILSKDQGRAKMQEMLGQKYILVSNAGPIDKLYFYKPVIGIRQQFEVEMEK